MATNLFSLVGSILVDNSKANESIQQTDSKASKMAETFGKGVKAAGKLAAGVAAAGTAAVTGITSMAQSSADAMDVIDKGSQKMGITAEAYQEWSHAMSQSGMSIDTMQTGMKTLQNQMDGVMQGTTSSIEAFERLGVSVTDENGNLKDQTTMLNEVMYALADMEDGAERTALAVDLFGKAGTEMLPMLNSGSEGIDALKQEAHDLGLVFSDEAVTAGVTLGDTMANVKDAIGAVKTSLGNSLFPVVQKFADKLLTFVPKLQNMFERIAPVLESLFDKLMPVLFDLVDSILPLLESILNAVLPIFEMVASTILPVLVNLLTKLTPILQKLFDYLGPIIEKVLRPVLAIIDAVWPIVSTILDLVLSLLDPLFTILDALLSPLLALLSPLIGLLELISPILEVINAVLSPILNLINLILTPITDFINWIFGGITSGVDDVSGSLGEGGLLGSLGDVSGFLFGDFSEAFELFGGILGEAFDFVGEVFSGIVNFIKDPKQALSDFFEWIGNKVAEVKESLQTIVQGVGDLMDAKEDEEKAKDLNKKEAQRVQSILDAGGEQADILRKALGLGPNDKAPGLAEGAVLQPNHPFLAVVGDQKQGVNVEAPLTTIQEAVRAELENIQFNVLFDVNGDTDKIFNAVKKKSWTERKRTGSVQMA